MKSLLKFLQELPPATVTRLYGEPLVVLSIWGQLPPLAQYTVQRLLLIRGATPFEELRSWHPPDFKSTQNSALLLMKNLHILQGKSGDVWLNGDFQKSLGIAISGEVPTFGTRLTVNDPALNSVILKRIAELARQRWEEILYALVTGTREKWKGLQMTREILIGAKLASPEGNITQSGFQFLLGSKMDQLWTLLIQYFMMFDASGRDVVDAIHAICRLSLMPPAASLFGFPNEAIELFLELGLAVRQKSLATADIPAHLLPTIQGGVMATQLAGFLRSGASDDLLQSYASTSSLGYIVVETNYKVYAYTRSPLQIAILGLFLKLRDRHENMVHGQLTGPSVQAAMAKGITAQQIIAYLTSHLHPIMKRNDPSMQLPAPEETSWLAGDTLPPLLPPVIEDQVHLWERDRNRLITKEAYMYQQFANEQQFNRAVEEARRDKCMIYVNYPKRILIIEPDGHAALKAFIVADK